MLDPITIDNRPEALKPFNIKIMDVEKFINENGCLPVTSFAIKAPSSSDFHPGGLFSEEIFGQIGSPERRRLFGYIELNTEVFAPVVYKNLIKLSNLYDEIMGGRAYALWDPVLKDFRRVFGDPGDIPEANTGYSFFVEHFPELQFAKTESGLRDDRINVIEKYKTVCLYKRFPVIPAGIRDLDVEEGRMSQDDINKIYTAIMAISLSIPPGSKSNVFDSVRYNLQKRLLELYEHIVNLMDGKSGFLQGAWTRRRVALGTRNVITGASYEMSSPKDPQALKTNESKIGLYQTMKGLTPVVCHHFKRAFIDPILGDADSVKIALTNLETFELQYYNIPYLELARFNSIEAIKTWMNKFKNVDIRQRPILIKDEEGNKAALCLVYDDGSGDIYLCRSIKDLSSYISNVNKDFLRPITWVEAFYLSTIAASEGKHVFITRYPVLEDGSMYPTRIHVTTTSPGKVVVLRDLLSADQEGKQYPQYPVLGVTSYQDTVVIEASRLKGLTADYDGDTVSADFIMSEEANTEAAEYLNNVKAFLSPEKKMLAVGSSDLINIMCVSMTDAPSTDNLIKTDSSAINRFRSRFKQSS